MASSNFIDQINIFCKAGKGGAGLIHFVKAKFVPKGGPDGGDGGRGGHILLRGNSQCRTLFHLRYQKHIKASNGQPGGQNCRTGANGKDIILNVPLGTVARESEHDRTITEVFEDQKLYMLLQGGKGGWGNAHFKSPTRQTPYIAYPGEMGQAHWITLELKLFADVGLVGFPNAGKSTLLSVVSAAKPQIDSYPFTTLTPQLGVVHCYHDYTLVMADIPGLIEGAASGKGLGTRFLRHIERNATLLFVISAEEPHIGEAYRILLKELETHNPDLLVKRRLLAISKMDLLSQDQKDQCLKTLPWDIDYIPISSHTGEGIQTLKYKLLESLRKN